jgi:hypothetical protein
MTTDCPSVNSCIPSVVKVATLSVSDTFSIGLLNVTNIGRITVSAVSIIWFKYESLYKDDDTPSTDLNSVAVIMVGMSSPYSL